MTTEIHINEWCSRLNEDWVTVTEARDTKMGVTGNFVKYCETVEAYIIEVEGRLVVCSTDPLPVGTAVY